MAEIDFYQPTRIGTVEIGRTQINKLLPFKTTNGVFIGAPIVNVYDGNILVKQYTLGDGLTLTGTNSQGVEKTLTLEIDGTDYVSYVCTILQAECTFFNVGDVEITFKLDIK